VTTLIPTGSPLTDTPLSLAAIQRLNPRVGYIAGREGTGVVLAKTSDAGATWHRITVPARSLTTLRFIDEQVGWVAGLSCGAADCRGVVLRTEDGGQTWQETISVPSTPGSYPIPQVQAVDGQIAWVLPPTPYCATYPCVTDLRHTIDGGRTWTTSLSGNLAAIRFASASTGWVAAYDQRTFSVRATSDGGTTWGPGFPIPGDGPTGLDAATTQTAWLLTRYGGYCTASSCEKYELFRTVDGGRSWASLGNPKAFACSGGHLVGPLFASVGRGWLGIALGAGGANVGPGGLLRTQDGGHTWGCASSPANVTSISAADPLRVWVTSEERVPPATALYATEDGGGSWHPLDLGSLR